MTVARRRARAFGLALEWRAVLWLRLKGYRILARNFTAQGGELDIIAVSPERWASKGQLCFIEVRGRLDAQAALDSVGPVKQERVRLAAKAYLRRNNQFAGLPLRFDVIAAGRAGGLRHTRHAFDA